MFSDTHPKIEKRLIEMYREKSQAEKLKMVSEINNTVQQLSLIGMKKRHPNSTNEDLNFRIAALRINKEIMKKAFGWNVEKKGL